MTAPSPGFGNRIAPPRFVAFVAVLLAGLAAGVPALGWARGGMAAFDGAALVFLGACVPLLGDAAAAMRDAARANEAGRGLMLAVAGIVTAAILVAVGVELGQKGAPQPAALALVVATLALAWLFANTIYALHYAHVFYTPGADGRDAGGLEVPDSDTPTYWDFVYFAFTLGMTFQTSDVTVRTTRLRRIVVAHSLVAFVFNLGVVAFTINVLGGG